MSGLYGGSGTTGGANIGLVATTMPSPVGIKGEVERFEAIAASGPGVGALRLDDVCAAGDAADGAGAVGAETGEGAGAGAGAVGCADLVLAGVRERGLAGAVDAAGLAVAAFALGDLARRAGLGADAAAAAAAAADAMREETLVTSGLIAGETDGDETDADDAGDGVILAANTCAVGCLRFCAAACRASEVRMAL